MFLKTQCKALLPSLTYSQKGSVTAPPLPQCTVDSEEVSQGSLSLLKNVHDLHKLIFTSV